VRAFLGLKNERTEKVKATYNRFPAIHSMDVRVLTPPARIIDPIYCGNHLFPHSILFIYKSVKSFSLEGFIHITEASNATTCEVISWP